MIGKNFRELVVSACLLILIASGCDIAWGQTTMKQGPAVPVNFCIHPEELELYRMINEYRKHYNLPPISLSKSLSYIAALHAKDLYLNHPDQGSCNFHSWSNKGSWSPFCYPKDENKKSSVWDKPRELTKYPTKAYEIVYWENKPLVKDTIIMVWKTEEYFNNFLLNSGKWQGKNWNAIGIAVYENYACAWFGEVSDPEGDVIVCGTKPVNKAQDTVKQAPVVKLPVKTKKTKTGKPMINKGDSLALKHPDTVTLKPSRQIPVKQPGVTLPTDSITAIYNIIIKTNLSLDAATKLADTLKAGAYPGATVQEKNGKFRISVFESADKFLVMAKLKEVKKSYKDAWLLKR